MSDIKGNPQNVEAVAKGEVLVSWDDNPTFTTKGVPSEDSNWMTVGILNDGSSVELNRTVERTKVNGWGYGVVATSAKPGELTASCETLEDNEATRKIAFPRTKSGDGITVEGEANILYHTSDVANVFVALVEQRQDGSTVLKVSRHKAVATMENLGFSQEVTGKTINFDFIPGKDGDVFDELRLDATDSEVADNNAIIRFKAEDAS